MTKKKKFIFGTLLNIMLICGLSLIMLLAVKAVANNTILASDTVVFVADKYVKADVKVSINDNEWSQTYSFNDVDDRDEENNKIVTLENVSSNSSYWKVVNEGYTAKQVVISFTITNTSTHSGQIRVGLTRNGVDGDTEQNDDFSITTDYIDSVLLNEQESITFNYTYYVSGLADVTCHNLFNVVLETID